MKKLLILGMLLSSMLFAKQGRWEAVSSKATGKLEYIIEIQNVRSKRESDILRFFKGEDKHIMVFNFLTSKKYPIFHFYCQVDDNPIVTLVGGFHGQVPYISSGDNDDFYSLIEQMEKDWK